MAMQFYEPFDLRDIILKHANGEDNLNKIEWSNEAKAEIIKASKSIVSAATVSLTNKIPFIGTFTSNVNKIPTFKLEAPMGVNVTTNGLSSTPNLFFNPIWMTFKRGIVSEGEFLQSFDNVVAVVLHEMFHLLYDHMAVYEYYWNNGYGEIANIATDAQINQDALIAADSELTKYGITLESVRKLSKNPSLEPKQSSMYYFKALMKEQQNLQQQSKNQVCPDCGQPMNQPKQDQNDQKDQGSSGQGQQDQDSNGQDGQDGQGEGKDGQGQDGGSGSSDSGHQCPGCGNHSSGQGSGQGQPGQGQPGQGSGQGQGQVDPLQQAGPMGAGASHEVWKQSPDDAPTENQDVASGESVTNAIADTVKNTLQQNPNIDTKGLKERGLIAGNILDAALSGSATSGKLPIRSILIKGTGRLKAGSKKTYSRINKQQSNNVRVKRGKKVVHHKNVRTFIDNSGSMGSDEINWAVKEIAAVAKQAKANLEIIPFDSVVYPGNKQEVKKNGTFEFVPCGRGGTSFQPVFDYLRDETTANNNDDLIIILTDGGGESRVDTHKLRNIIWILVEMDRNVLSVNEPVGQVAWLDQDNKYKLHKMSK